MLNGITKIMFFGYVLIDVMVKKPSCILTRNQTTPKQLVQQSRDVDHLTVHHFVRTFARGSIFCPPHLHHSKVLKLFGH